MNYAVPRRGFVRTDTSDDILVGANYSAQVCSHGLSAKHTLYLATRVIKEPVLRHVYAFLVEYLRNTWSFTRTPRGKKLRQNWNLELMPLWGLSYTPHTVNVNDKSVVMQGYKDISGQLMKAKKPLTFSRWELGKSEMNQLEIETSKTSEWFVFIFLSVNWRGRSKQANNYRQNKRQK